MAHMVHSVELLLDSQLDAAVRAEWDALSAAGLPSQNRHTGSSNRPHVTVGVAKSMPPVVDAAAAVGFEQFPIGLGGLLVFGGGAITLARLVVPSIHLLDVHDRVHRALASLPDSDNFEHLTPGAWTPHVTLARRLTAAQASDAITVLAPTLVDLRGTAESMRRWDGDAKREWLIG